MAQRSPGKESEAVSRCLEVFVATLMLSLRVSKKAERLMAMDIANILAEYI